MASYSYTPLSLDGDFQEIRLVALEPGPWDAEIKCCLQHAVLNGTVKYGALSYVWGDPNDLRSISLGGYPWSVRANLEQALRHMRDENETRILWIDAICINQADVNEREAQVGRMREIYMSADLVVAWVGPPGPDSQVALPAIQQIVTTLDQSDHWESDLEAAGLTGFVATATHLRLMGFNTTDVDWDAVWTFLSRPYWRRIWAVQELEASGFLQQTKGVIMSGFNWIPKWIFDGFMMFILATSRMPSLEKVGSLPEDQPERIIALKRMPPAFEMFGVISKFFNYRSGKAQMPPELWKLMVSTKTFLATDMRDKLYALLGMADDAWRAMDFSISYSKPPAEVFTEFTKSLITTRRSLACLLYNRMGTNSFGPSWVPDVNLPRPILYGIAWLDENRGYKAGGDEEIQVEFDNHGLLIAAGTRIGVIQKVIGPMGDLDPPLDEATDRASRMPEAMFMSESARKLLEFRWKVPPSEYETYWRTLIMDEGGVLSFEESVCPAPASVQEACQLHFNSSITQLEETWKDPGVRKVSLLIEQAVTNRCFFRTSSGRMGLGPLHSKPGDVVAALFGAARFVMLRPKEAYYELVGDAYVQGGMFGELVANNVAERESFSIC